MGRHLEGAEGQEFSVFTSRSYSSQSGPPPDAVRVTCTAEKSAREGGQTGHFGGRIVMET
jgi:hypothetical protein